MVVNNAIDNTEGLIDDLPKEQKEQKENQSDYKEVIGGLQDQISKLDAELKESKSYKEDRDEIIDRHARAIGMLEGSGIAKYDAETGKITAIQKVNKGPDPIDRKSVV